MGCVTSLLALPFKLAGTAASAGGLVLVVSGFKVKHPGFCALGAVLGVIGMIVGYFWWLGAATAIAGGYGFTRFRRLPR